MKKSTCPLGNDCEVIKNNILHRCKWYINLKGKDPQSEEIIDKWNCAIVWMVVTQIENNQFTRGTNASIQSLRNTVAGGNGLLEMIGNKRLNHDDKN